MSLAALEGGGNVGRQHQSEGDDMVTRGQVGALVYIHLVLDILLVAGEVVSLGLIVDSPRLCPEHLSLPHQLHLDLLEGLLLGQVDQELPGDDLAWEVDPDGLVKLYEEILQSAHGEECLLCLP